jgi:mono/diheme cytochrome c family protein
MATVRVIRANTVGAARKLVSVSLLILAPVVLGACVSDDAVPAVPDDDVELVAGRTIYANNCVSCHGPTGGGSVGSKLNGGRLTERLPDPADQRAIVVDGGAKMPAFREKLSAEEIDAVVRYTREIIASVE